MTPAEADAAVELLESAIAVPSPSGEEHPLALHLAARMRAAGLTASIDAAGNVIGETEPRPGPTVMLVGHLDTVPGELPVRRTGGVITGRGAVDAKGPLAAMISAVAAEADFPGRLVVAGVVEEETPRSRGAVHLGRTRPAPDALIVGEPGGWQGVVLGYKGKLDLRYRVARAATHPSNPEPKATEVAAAFWQHLLDLLGPDAGHASFGTPGATLVAMHGDAAAAELEIGVRTPVGFDIPAFTAALRERADGGTLDVLNAVDAVLSPRTDPVVRALTAGVRAAGGTPRPTRKTGTSDMNTLAEVWDVPMATYGPGDSALDHCDDEHIAVDDYLRGIAVLRTALRHLAALPPRTAVPAAGPAAAGTHPDRPDTHPAAPAARQPEGVLR
ncbi:M20/M25/M40 family metallo-hydrolase [Kitasatospora sp. NPDC085895]|uniref:M20/M25/M40 family metallo-hydrolase n=1 Tax=Kitasatospora sp. NPDC085895 TaxID=3155057 RepID=UPI00344F1734